MTERWRLDVWTGGDDPSTSIYLGPGIEAELRLRVALEDERVTHIEFTRVVIQEPR